MIANVVSAFLSRTDRDTILSSAGQWAEFSARSLKPKAKFRVHTDVIDMKVCRACAEEARELGIAVDVLDLGDQRNDQA